MMFNEFEEWMEENSASRKVFMTKWKDIQIEKNKKRNPVNKKWDMRKIERTGSTQWKTIITNAYQKIRSEKGVPRYNGKQIWIDFMNEVSFLEMFDDGINELEFE
ncbi:hypothetical protein NE261_00515 [Enterococcus italicus]|uniref:hypothetical protein n=1 Tax=Enterococcus italicus TaxID=246144 RepID=UPI0020747FA5|nr:hypothetical protein [Enterococcus italicus]MCM6930301.1 hypothetical protein [Enterococcus italicus]